MIPEIGFKKQIPIGELPQWLVELRENKVGEEVHKVMYQTRSGLEIYKVDGKYVVVSPYAPIRLEAYVVEIGDKTRADEHAGFDLRAEHHWERQEDMRRDAFEDAYEDREPEYDEDW